MICLLTSLKTENVMFRSRYLQLLLAVCYRRGCSRLNTQAASASLCEYVIQNRDANLKTTFRQTVCSRQDICSALHNEDRDSNGGRRASTPKAKLNLRSSACNTARCPCTTRWFVLLWLRWTRDIPAHTQPARTGTLIQLMH